MKLLPLKTLFTLTAITLLLRSVLGQSEIAPRSTLAGHTQSVQSATFSPDGKYVVTASRDGTAKIWETAEGRLIHNLTGHTDYVNSAIFSPDGKYLATASDDKTAIIWLTTTGKRGKDLPGHTQSVQSATFSPDGKYVVTASRDGTAKIWETATSKLIYTLIGGTIKTATFSPDGKYVVTASNERISKIWATATGKLIYILAGHTKKVRSATFSPDGKYVVTASDDNTAKIWEPASDRLIHNLTGHTYYVMSAIFSPNGKYIVTASGDNTAKIWETASGKLIHNLSGHIDIVWSATFSPDGKYVVTASSDNKVKIWETATGRLIINLSGHTKSVRSATFSPDGKYVVTASDDNTAKIWEIVPKPTAPANVQIQFLSFSDKDGNNNNILDASEKAEIKFTLSNSGKGDAYNLVAEVKELSSIHGVKYDKQIHLGNLSSGGNTIVSIPVSAAMSVDSGKVEFEIQIKEGNGFDADPIRISFNTQKFKNPLVAIADHKFSTDGGKIRLGQLIALEVIVQNKGQGEARNINVEFTNPIHVFPGGNNNFSIDKLNPNESKKLVYEFFANRIYAAKEIPVEVIITESYGQYGEKRTLNVSLEQTLSQTQTLTVEAQAVKPVLIDNVSLRSDIDSNIPVTGKINSNRYALVIGNEDYKKYQTGLQSDQNVLFARNDAQIFKEYSVKTFGVPEKQAFILIDATRAQMNRELERVVELVKLTPNAELIFYYAGHGLPDMETQQGYLIPVDVTASNLKDAISLKDLYAKLASSKAAKTLVFLDACFSGGGRGENGLLAARTVKVKPKGDIIEGNIVAFTATSGEEVSLPLHKEYHGLFTYHLLKKLKDTQGQLTLEQLKSYLESEIPKASLIENGMRQSPQVLVAPDLSDQWLLWKIQ